MNNYEEDGVLISQDAIENSLHKKAKRKQTLAQLPVYRAVGNLKYVIVGITKNAPRSLRRFTDSLQEKADITKKLLLFFRIIMFLKKIAQL